MQRARTGSGASLWQLRAAFRHALQAIWESAGSKPIGLAVSGGVDSMALARLCSELHEDRPQQQFFGFIVDHGVRESSHEEAFSVAERLTRLNIQPRVLTLDWSNHGKPRKLRNFEGVARNLRYKAIGKACYNLGIADLLVAHHADDQAETILSRIIDGYYGHGLQGIKPKTAIPECSGVYGVDASGVPKQDIWPHWDGYGQPKGRAVDIEAGGVNVHRPLLPFSKNQLISVCTETKTRWFEDRTNKDVGLAKRNTLRHLSRRNSLPVALQQASLCALSARVAERIEDINDQAQRLFESYEISFHTRNSFLSIEAPKDKRGPEYIFGFAKPFIPSEQNRRIAAALLRKMLQPVSPKSVIPLSSLNKAIDFIWTGSSLSRLNTAGVVISFNPPMSNVHEQMENTEAASKLELSRAIPTYAELTVSTKRMQLVNPRAAKGKDWLRTEWVLWDNRFWIRVSRTKRAHEIDPFVVHFEVQFITGTGIHETRQQLRQGDDLICFNEALSSARGTSRGTSNPARRLPVLVACYNVAGCVEHEYVALPTLGWASKTAKTGVWHCEKLERQLTPDAHWVCEVSYKNVELALNGERHKIVG